MKTKTNVRPTGNRVLVKRDEAETVTKQGIYLPETSKTDKPQFATVVAVGEGKLNDKGDRVPIGISVTDRVIVSMWGGTEITIEDEPYLVIDADEILAIVD